MIRCWVTHQQTWSKNCEFVTTSGSNTNNLEKIWMFGPWLPLMTAISQRLEAVLKHQNAFKTFIAHIPWFIQPHLQIWFCLVIGLSKTTKTTITVHECTFDIFELQPSVLLNFDLKNLGYIFSPARQQHDLPVSTSPRCWGIFEAHHHPVPNVWFGDLSRLLHALQTHQASQLLQQRLQPLERFVHAKKSQGVLTEFYGGAFGLFVVSSLGTLFGRCFRDVCWKN